MATALPARNILDGSSAPATSTMKIAMGSLRDFLAETIGTVGGSPSAVTSINYGPISGLRNILINGDCREAQRGTSFPAVASVLYTADRWAFYRSALALGATVSQQSSTGIVGSSGYSLRVQRDSGNTSVDPINLVQCIETSIARRLQSTPVVLSFMEKCGATMSAGTVSVSIISGTGTDQGVDSARAGTWTGISALSPDTFVTTNTSFTKHSFLFNIPSGSTELMVKFTYTPVGTAGANDWFEVTELQLETGTIASKFEYLPTSVVQNLCNRYYQRVQGGFGGVSLNASNNSAAIAYLTGLRTYPPAVTWINNVVANGFPTTSSSISTSGTAGFRVTKTASSSVQDGYFIDIYAVSAEL